MAEPGDETVTGLPVKPVKPVLGVYDVLQPDPLARFFQTLLYEDEPSVVDESSTGNTSAKAAAAAAAAAACSSPSSASPPALGIEP